MRMIVQTTYESQINNKNKFKSTNNQWILSPDHFSHVFIADMRTCISPREFSLEFFRVLVEGMCDLKYFY